MLKRVLLGSALFVPNLAFAAPAIQGVGGDLIQPGIGCSISNGPPMRLNCPGVAAQFGPNGVAPTDANNLVPLANLPSFLSAAGGTVQPPSATQSSTQSADFTVLNFTLGTDTIKSSGNIYGVSTLHLLDVLPGGHTGARNVIVSEVDLNGPAAAGSNNHDYVAGYFRGIANSGDGGTALLPQGAVFGINPVAQCGAGANYLLDCTGDETDVGMYAGGSSAYRVGKRIASYGTAKGALLDAGMQFTVLGTSANTGFTYGIVFSSFGGASNPVTQTLITGAGDGTVPLTAGIGIDLTAYTFASYSLAMPGGFRLANNGTLTTPVIGATAASFPKVLWSATGNATDQKQWQAYADPSGNFLLTSLNDAANSTVLAMQFTRGTGNAISSATIGPLLIASGGISTPGITESLAQFTASSQPSNPASGNFIIYSDSSTGHLTALKSDGTKIIIAN